MPLEERPFGETKAGEQVTEYVLSNERTELRVMTYGATITSLRTPDRWERLGETVLGYDTLAPYLETHPYFGSVVGRFANRIAFGRFCLDGEEYSVSRNDGPHHLHGGLRGFDKAVWRAAPRFAGSLPAVSLHHVSPGGDEGYPGTLSATVTYALTEAGALRITYGATTDAPTLVNLTQHAYFNLAGAGTVLDHVLRIQAPCFLPVDEGLIPTGHRIPVFGTPMDFREPCAIGARIRSEYSQIRHAGGYDHSFVLPERGDGLALAAEVMEPSTGRVLRVHTTQPGLHLYTGNFLDDTSRARAGGTYARHAGLCLETHHFPDSPNKPAFPSTVLRPGERYEQITELSFDVLGPPESAGHAV